MRRIFALICALLLGGALPAGATPGGTDRSGGHTDRLTGEYHYHHGYPAHQHVGGTCPYDPEYRGNATPGSRPGPSGEDKDDAAVSGRAKPKDRSFAGIKSRRRCGLPASRALVSLLIVGGFLGTVKWKKRTGAARGSSQSDCPGARHQPLPGAVHPGPNPSASAGGAQG